MDIKKFIEKFAEQFDETDAFKFTENTKFKELDEWTSIMGLSIIVMVDEELGISINGDDIQNTSTIKELFDLITNK